jgi:hypothetical protein
MNQPIRMSDHAREEARRRGVSEAIVLSVARDPEQRVMVRARREVRQSRITDAASGKLYLVRVIVDFGEHGDTIVTVYRTSRIRKYWRAP